MEEKLYKIIGQRIRHERESKNMSQTELAERIGLARSSMANIEFARQKVQLHSLYKMAIVLNVSVTNMLPSVEDVTEVDNELLALSVDPTKYSEEKLRWLKAVITNQERENLEPNKVGGEESISVTRPSWD